MTGGPRIGIVGLGFVSERHRSGFIDAGAQVTAIADIDPAAVERAGEAWGIPAQQRFTDHRALVGSDEVDIVVSAVPNDAHAAVATAAIRAGKHVFAEKPLTRSLDESNELRAVRTGSSAVFAVDFSHRYAPAFQLAKDILAAGEVGEIVHVQVRYYADRFVDYKDHPHTWRHSKRIGGSGGLADIGSHAIDLTRFLVGEFDEVTGLLHTITGRRRTQESDSTLLPVDVDDLTAFTARLNGGSAVGTFVAHKNAIGYRHDILVDVFGRAGTLRFSQGDRAGVDIARALAFGDLATAPFERLAVDSSFERSIYVDFLSAFAGDAPDRLPSFDDGFQVQRILHEIAASAEDDSRSKRVPRLDDIDGPEHEEHLR